MEWEFHSEFEAQRKEIVLRAGAPEKEIEWFAVEIR